MSVVRIEREPPLALVTLDRPEVHNALDHALVLELIESLATLGKDDAIRAVVITGAGEEAFCAGADMKRMAAAEVSELGIMLADTRRLFRTLASIGKPTVAAVNGHAHGGGAEIACACDVRIGCRRTTFRFPGAVYGMAVGTWHLPTIVGLPKAKELLFTADEVDAEEALRIGLLNHLVEEGELLDRAMAIARRITEKSSEVLAAIKSLLNAGIGSPLQQRFFRELYSNQERQVNRQVRGHFAGFVRRQRNAD